MDTAGSHTFAMVKASAVTHSVNNDQRRMPLAVVSQTGGAFTLRIPANVNVALPGFYFLFAMNANGVPSVAESFHIDL
jgi:galactose oxidase